MEIPEDVCHYLSLVLQAYNTPLANKALRSDYSQTRPTRRLLSMTNLSGTMVKHHESTIVDVRTPDILVRLISVYLCPSLTTEFTMLTS